MPRAAIEGIDDVDDADEFCEFEVDDDDDDDDWKLASIVWKMRSRTDCCWPTTLPSAIPDEPRTPPGPVNWDGGGWISGGGMASGCISGRDGGLAFAIPLPPSDILCSPNPGGPVAAAAAATVGAAPGRQATGATDGADDWGTLLLATIIDLFDSPSSALTVALLS